MAVFFEQFILFYTYSGISIILFLILLLSRNSSTQSSRKTLIYLLINILVIFLSFTSIHLKHELFSAILMPIGAITPFAFGPLLFYYIKSIYQPKLKLDKNISQTFITLFFGCSLFQSSIVFSDAVLP